MLKAKRSRSYLNLPLLPSAGNFDTTTAFATQEILRKARDIRAVIQTGCTTQETVIAGIVHMLRGKIMRTYIHNPVLRYSASRFSFDRYIAAQHLFCRAIVSKSRTFDVDEDSFANADHIARAKCQQFFTGVPQLPQLIGGRIAVHVQGSVVIVLKQNSMCCRRSEGI